VIDTGYPATAGVELIERLRGDPHTRHVGVIVISGHVFPRDRAAAMKAGCEHITNGVALPAVPTLPGGPNSEVHNAGDIWTTSSRRSHDPRLDITS